MDILIIGVIIIEFVIFLLNYEKALMIPLFAAIQFVALIVYLIYSVRLRSAFEEVTNQEDLFFSKQFNQIKQNYNSISYRLSDFLDRQNAVESIHKIFNYSKFYYRKSILNKDDEELFFDLLMLTDQGIFIIKIFDSRMIIQGDYQKSHIILQYSQSNKLEVVNPLSPVHPVYQEVESVLGINDKDIIKRVLIITDDSFATNLDTLDDNQNIAKDYDVSNKINELINKNKIQLSLDKVKEYEELIDKRITG